jgi:hypothetical protein
MTMTSGSTSTPGTAVADTWSPIQRDPACSASGLPALCAQLEANPNPNQACSRLETCCI